MLQNAYFLAKIGADTAENEQRFADILPKCRRVADRCRRAGPAGDAEHLELLEHVLHDQHVTIWEW